MKVSIIVPVYNVKDYLETSLDSLINQNFEDYEILLVNDGSTDGSAEILNKYAIKYPDKIIVLDKENGGQGSARNLALENARGEYVMFVGSDDYIDKDALKISYNQAIKNEADIVCFREHVIKDGKEIENTNNFVMESNDTLTYILNQMGPCFKLIKTDLIKDNKLYFPKLRAYEDIAVVPAYGLFANKIIFIDDKLYYYVMRSGSTMNQSVYSEKLEHIFPSLNNLMNIFKENNVFKKYYAEVEFIYIKHLLHGAGLRFIEFDNYSDNLNKIIEIMNNEFSNWRKNKYYQKQNLKYRIVCELLYRKNINLLKLLKRK